MDSDLLRLVLLVLGVVLVVGIYLWDRYKRITRHYPRIRMGRNLEEPAFDLPDVDDDVGEVRVRSCARAGAQPAHGEPAGEIGVHDATATPVTHDAPGERLDMLGLKLDKAPPAEELSREPMLVQPREQAPDSKESQFTLDLEFNAHGDSDYLNLDPALLEEVPRMIVQINVMAKAAPFTAAQVQRAAAQVDLHYGDMHIYHRQMDNGQVLFSMASVVEPGTLPAGADDTFTTPGLLLFTQLPGARDGLAIYADMLFTGERLSALLDAVLQDETRSKLTKQSIEHTREGILEHRRRIQLLRSRH